jgi:hypothetical protein
MKKAFICLVRAVLPGIGLLLTMSVFAQTASPTLRIAKVSSEPVEKPQYYVQAALLYGSIYCPMFDNVYSPGALRTMEYRIQHARHMDYVIRDSTFHKATGQAASDSGTLEIREYDLRPALDADGVPYRRIAELMPRLGNWRQVIEEYAQNYAVEHELFMGTVVYVHCIVEKDGRLTHIRPYQFVDFADVPDYDKYRQAAAKVVEGLPHFEPAQDGGEVVRSATMLEIWFNRDQLGGRD